MKLLRKRNCFEFIFLKILYLFFFESLIPLFSVLPVNKKVLFYLTYYLIFKLSSVISH